MIGKVVGMLAGVENDGGKKRSKREEKWRKEFMAKKRKEHIELIASKFPNVAPEIIAEALDSAEGDVKQAAMSLKAQLLAHGGASHSTTLEQARKDNFSQYIAEVPTARQRTRSRADHLDAQADAFRKQGDAQRARAKHGARKLKEIQRQRAVSSGACGCEPTSTDRSRTQSRQVEQEGSLLRRGSLSKLDSDTGEDGLEPGEEKRHCQRCNAPYITCSGNPLCLNCRPTMTASEESQETRSCVYCGTQYISMSGNPLCLRCRDNLMTCTICGEQYVSPSGNTVCTRCRSESESRKSSVPSAYPSLDRSADDLDDFHPEEVTTRPRHETMMLDDALAAPAPPQPISIRGLHPAHHSPYDAHGGGPISKKDAFGNGHMHRSSAHILGTSDGSGQRRSVDLHALSQAHAAADEADIALEQRLVDHQSTTGGVRSGACSGMLLKREKKLGTWKRRLFSLTQAELCYYRREGEMEPVGKVHVTGVSSVLASSTADARPHRFDINCVARRGRDGVAQPLTLFVAAETAEDMQRWMAAVEAAVQQANNQNWADSDSDGASPKPRGSVVLDNVI